MAQSWFIWNGFDCRSKGVLLDGPVAIVRPEERVQHSQIPGRSGDLTQLEGEDIYNSYIQTATILVHGGYRVREIYRWLRGAGYVTFSGEPDKKQAARIIGAITLNKHSYNLDWWTGECQFYCQPLKELLIDNPVTITSSGTAIRNNGDVESRPLYKITVASGKTSITLTAAWTQGSATRLMTITVTGLTGGSTYYIDSDALEVYNANRTDLLTKNSGGTFPVLGPGNNVITFTNIASVEITKRERFL